MLTNDYLSVLTEGLTGIAASQRQKIEAAAGIVCDVLCEDGLIYVFGCGHSHMLAEETFYRAGGLACVYPIFEETLMLHRSASFSSKLERSAGIAGPLLDRYPVTRKDAMICVSTSGINAVPVEMAAAAAKRGMKVIGVTSMEYAEDEPRNPMGKHLYEVCDVWLDNGAPHGDACLQPEGLPVRMTPVSTVFSAFLINAILAEAAERALQRGVKPPVFLSGNVEGGPEYNKKLLEKYRSRIPCL